MSLSRSRYKVFDPALYDGGRGIVCGTRRDGVDVRDRLIPTALKPHHAECDDSRKRYVGHGKSESGAPDEKEDHYDSWRQPPQARRRSRGLRARDVSDVIGDRVIRCLHDRGAA